MRKEVIALINKIEKEKKFEANVSNICDWCEFRSICPKWSHLYKLEAKEANEFLKDDGVELVNKLAELNYKEKQVREELETEMEKVKQALIEFAKKNKLDTVFGSNYKANIKIEKYLKFPEKRDAERKN